jgi:hypothetical protein
MDEKYVLKGKITVKGTTQVSGLYLKWHFYMFEKSQKNHNRLDCYKFFGNIFHLLQSLHAQNLT